MLDTETQEVNTVYLYHHNETEVAVGRHMCAGHFRYRMNRVYKVRFTACDFAGNSIADVDSKWIEFDSPYVWR